MSSIEHVMKDLKSQFEAGEKLLYLDKVSWSVYEGLGLSPEIRESYAKVGYDHAFNPRTKRDEICIPYKGYPVFRDEKAPWLEEMK